MCIKDNPSGLQDPKPARKTRTKTRRPKFLSLRLSLSPETPTHSPETPTHSPENPTHQGSGPEKPDLDLFPLRPESPDADASVAARFFDSDGGATIAGLLAAGGGGGESDKPAAAASSDTYRISSSPSEGSLTYACAAAAQDRGRFLVRAAMRGRGREEERWVSLSEVVEKKEEEVTSCDAGAGYAGCGSAQGLSLKLDYQEVMDTWSDRAPPYVGEGEGPQTVPDVNDDFLGNDRCNNVWMDGWGSTAGIGGLWSVPECDESSIIKMEDEEANKEKMRMMGQREASVLRYKEKRHNRLFSKRIRYEVRKLNAEKRPRMKGRFVKRS